MAFSRILAGAAALVFTTGAWAQVSLMDVYRQAVTNDPTLAIQKLNEDTAATQVKSGFSELLPRFDASASYNVSSLETGGAGPDFGDGKSYRAEIRASQKLFALAAIDGYEALKRNATRAEYETRVAEQDLMLRVAEAYINILRAKDDLSTVESELEAVRRQYQQTQQRFEVGLVTVTDVLDAQASLDQTQVALIRTQSNYDIALQSLSVITGEVPDAVMSLGSRLPIPMPEQGGEVRWIEFALQYHPDILATEKALESGELELRARRNNRLPVVSANASIDYSGHDREPSGVDFGDRFGSSIGVTVSVPLYTGGSIEAQIITRGLQNNIIEQRLSLLKRNIRVNVGNLYRQLRAAAQNTSAQQQVVKSRESALEATRVGYDVGTRNIVEVLRAQQALFAARQAYANSRYDYLITRLRLKQAAGQLTVEDLSSIETFLVTSQ